MSEQDFFATLSGMCGVVGMFCVVLGLYTLCTTSWSIITSLNQSREPVDGVVHHAINALSLLIYAIVMFWGSASFWFDTNSIDTWAWVHTFLVSMLVMVTFPTWLKYKRRGEEFFHLYFVGPPPGTEEVN